MADTTSKAADDLANNTYDLGAQLAQDIVNGFAKKGISMTREQLGMMASGFTVGAAFIRAEQAAAEGECPNCARIDFLSTAHTSLGDAVAKLVDANDHGRAH